MQLQGHHVLILGLGASGLAMVRWCARAGAEVTVADTRDAPPQLAVLQAEWPAVRFVPGPFAAHLVEGTSVRAVFRSPGLSPEAVAPVVSAAQAAALVTLPEHFDTQLATTEAWLANAGSVYPQAVEQGLPTVQSPAAMRALTAQHQAGSQALADVIYAAWRRRWKAV